MRVVRVPHGSQWPRVYFFGCYSSACLELGHRFFCFRSVACTQLRLVSRLVTTPHKTMASPGMALGPGGGTVHMPLRNPPKGLQQRPRGTHTAVNLQGTSDDPLTTPSDLGPCAADAHTQSKAAEHDQSWFFCGSWVSTGPWPCCSRCSSECIPSVSQERGWT